MGYAKLQQNSTIGLVCSLFPGSGVPELSICWPASHSVPVGAFLNSFTGHLTHLFFPSSVNVNEVSK